MKSMLGSAALAKHLLNGVLFGLGTFTLLFSTVTPTPYNGTDGLRRDARRVEAATQRHMKRLEATQKRIL